MVGLDKLMKYSNQSLLIVKSAVAVGMAMCDNAVSDGRGAQTSDCAPAHGACALCITKGAIWRKNGRNLGTSRTNSGALGSCARV